MWARRGLDEELLTMDGLGDGESITFQGWDIRKSIWTVQVEHDGLKEKEDKKFGRQGGGGSPWRSWGRG